MGEGGLVGLDEVGLTDKRLLELAGKTEPFLARCWFQIAERADNLLARSRRCAHRLDQQVIGVALALVAACGAAHEHAHYKH